MMERPALKLGKLQRLLQGILIFSKYSLVENRIRKDLSYVKSF